MFWKTDTVHCTVATVLIVIVKAMIPVGCAGLWSKKPVIETKENFPPKGTESGRDEYERGGVEPANEAG